MSDSELSYEFEWPEEVETQAELFWKALYFYNAKYWFSSIGNEEYAENGWNNYQECRAKMTEESKAAFDKYVVDHEYIPKSE